VGRTRVARLLDALEARDGAPVPPPTRDPFELVVWETVAYLATDDARAEAFKALQRHVGTTPERLLAAKPATIKRAITPGGILPDLRVGKLLRAAGIALSLGDLRERARCVLARPRASAAATPRTAAVSARAAALFRVSRGLGLPVGGRRHVFRRTPSVMRCSIGPGGAPCSNRVLQPTLQK
jgi:hypothetical protein